MSNSKESLSGYFKELSQIQNVVYAITLLGSIGLVLTLLYGSAAAYEAQTKTYLAERSDQIRAQLAGHMRLGEVEKIYNQVMVTSAAPTFAEKLEMDRRGDPVNVREYPGAYLSNGHRTQVLGTISPGAKIDNVVWTVGPRVGSPVQDFWGAFECDKALGIAWKPEVIGNVTGKICAISGDNLMNSSPQNKK